MIVNKMENTLKTENNKIESPSDDLVNILGVGVLMECPKCGSKAAKMEQDHSAFYLKCLCGLNKLIQSKYADGSITDHIDIDEQVTLPKKGTKLMTALGALFGIEPATTGQVAESVNTNVPETEQQSNSDIASQLTILRYKGLSDIVEYKRGVTGGSTWKTTEKCKKLMGR